MPPHLLITFFVSTDLFAKIVEVNILDDGDNLSDHLPVIMNMSLQFQSPMNTGSESDKLEVVRLRWDKGNLNNYYALTHHYLSAVYVPVTLLCPDSTHNDADVKDIINTFYSELVGALSLAATQTVPSCKQNFFKYWWDEECQILKDTSISKHRAWVEVGQPHLGPVACDMHKARAEYKLYLKQKRYAEHTQFTNDLHEALIDKNLPSFWRSWNAKFGRKRICSQVINGVSDHGNIAEVFRSNFESASKPNCASMNDTLQQAFYSAFNSYCGAHVDEVINLELVDKMIRSLKRARASGPDGITAEHLLHSPSTVGCSFILSLSYDAIA